MMAKEFPPTSLKSPVEMQPGLFYVEEEEKL
jgi:hypothetical protein